MAIDIPENDDDDSIRRFQQQIKTASKEERLEVLEVLAQRFKSACDNFISGTYDTLDEKALSDPKAQQTTSALLNKLRNK